jgi:glycosyltransferase involved in cell wall biosynthesis
MSPALNTISVIIPTYNYARYLREAVDSALGQTYAPIEVIVIDDGSTDATPEVLASYGDRIRVIRQKNQGVAVARNAGIASARGKYLAFLDSDDIWYPRKLELQIARFDADPSLGLVHCGMETFDGEGNTVHVWRSGLEGCVASDMLRFDSQLVMTGSNIVVPKQVAQEIGGFDSRLPPSEDWDFCYRIATRYSIGFVAEVLVRYRMHGSGIHMNIAKMEKASLLALKKAFGSDDPVVQSLRNLSYGRLHRMLAGSYFETRQFSRSVFHVVQSLRHDPRNAGYFAAWPLRVISRLRTRFAS